MKVHLKSAYIKTIIFGLGLFFMLSQNSCCISLGGGNGDGLPKIIGDTNMTINIYPSPYNVFYNDSFSFKLIKPVFNYTKIEGMRNDKFPLLIDANEMDFLVTKNGVGIDTLSIQYDIEMKYFAGNSCDESYYYPKAQIKNCFTRNLLFNVVSYGLK